MTMYQQFVPLDFTRCAGRVRVTPSDSATASWRITVRAESWLQLAPGGQASRDSLAGLMPGRRGGPKRLAERAEPRGPGALSLGLPRQSESQESLPVEREMSLHHHTSPSLCMGGCSEKVFPPESKKEGRVSHAFSMAPRASQRGASDAAHHAPLAGPRPKASRRRGLLSSPCDVMNSGLARCDRSWGSLVGGGMKPGGGSPPMPVKSPPMGMGPGSMGPAGGEKSLT